MVVEKIDLKTLFEPVCKQFHIPIANSKGWSSMLQRAEYAKRFKEAEDQGLKCLLLYFGDHDPDGLRIADTIRKNLADLKDVTWYDGVKGYDPANLEIFRFGLDAEMIEEHDLIWIDNLITGSGGSIAQEIDGQIIQGKTKKGKPHPNFKMDYAQNYIKKYGVRKCEANALIPYPDIAREYVKEVIERYLGTDTEEKFQKAKEEGKQSILKFMKDSGIDTTLEKMNNTVDDFLKAKKKD